MVLEQQQRHAYAIANLNPAPSAPPLAALAFLDRLDGEKQNRFGGCVRDGWTQPR